MGTNQEIVELAEWLWEHNHEGEEEVELISPLDLFQHERTQRLAQGAQLPEIPG